MSTAPKEEENGLVVAQYSLIGTFVLKDGTKLIKLRNPWVCDSNWEGKYCDSDNIWEDVATTDKEKVGQKDKEDGVFFITYQDFVQTFNTISLAEYQVNTK